MHARASRTESELILPLDHQSLDLILKGADLVHEIGSLVGGDGSADDGASNTAGATESHLAGDLCAVLVM